MSSETPAEHLARLKIEFPAWKLWKGTSTGEFWGMPPAGHPRKHLVSAVTVEQLEERIRAAEAKREG
jgi:hypothetical protein